MSSDSIFRRKSVLTALVNAFIVAVGLIAARFLKPEDAAFLRDLWGAFQPLVLILIAAFAAQDHKANKREIEQAKSLFPPSPET